MTLGDLSALGGFIGGLAVFISLIYLALQIRQGTRHARAIIAQNRITRVVDVALRQAGPELADIVERGRAGDQTMTPQEVARFLSYTRAQFWSAEDNFLQHRESMLFEPLFKSFKHSVTGLLRAAGTQAAWECQRENFDPTFATFMDGVARDALALGFINIPVDWSSIVARYKAAAGGTQAKPDGTPN
jgi:hypothetical protein